MKTLKAFFLPLLLSVLMSCEGKKGQDPEPENCASYRLAELRNLSAQRPEASTCVEVVGDLEFSKLLVCPGGCWYLVDGEERIYLKDWVFDPAMYPPDTSWSSRASVTADFFPAEVVCTQFVPQCQRSLYVIELDLLASP